MTLLSIVPKGLNGVSPVELEHYLKNDQNQIEIYQDGELKGYQVRNFGRLRL